ncbi:hypothetical protein [Rubinisphaera brasiliensis]|uniref:Uncharacterized protein n=1 Tax=Rubinisphaera brasiliensis (strain ATCC 49424 / DSM 5305 / JCM 21570 / IAM 15109 / NBRC 103401 / IFAM 1448) TaxID=756272 RepID=F0SSZ1_RUBBR|nr:hypothetical protein [Rubinisphaera brasiliensis]ADY58146.1 hypothetical protein Plabr_0519 [Rubinisphaera brasiliensis DSM 5305]
MRLLQYILALIPIVFWLFLCGVTWDWSVNGAGYIQANRDVLLMLLGINNGVVLTFLAFTLDNTRFQKYPRRKTLLLFLLLPFVAPMIWLVWLRKEAT